jgi:hypothetical protein
MRSPHPASVDHPCCCCWSPTRSTSWLSAPLAAGAEVELPIQEMFWGERYGVLRDPFGHRWALSTAREELTPDEIAKRAPPAV